jgi:hypothetical protein
MSRTIWAITTTFHGSKRYVTGTTPRFKMEIAVELSEDSSRAHDFFTQQNAESILPRIYNPFERTYEAENIAVKQPAPIVHKTQSWIEEKVMK